MASDYKLLPEEGGWIDQDEMFMYEVGIIHAWYSAVEHDVQHPKPKTGKSVEFGKLKDIG